MSTSHRVNISTVFEMFYVNMLVLHTTNSTASSWISSIHKGGWGALGGDPRGGPQSCSTTPSKKAP